MCKSGKIFLIIVAICSLLIFTSSRYAFGAEGSHAGGGNGVSEPVIEHGNEGVTRQVIEDEAIRHGYYRGDEVVIDDNSLYDDSNNDDGDTDDDNDDKVTDQ
jgi:hypothetical protein